MMKKKIATIIICSVALLSGMAVQEMHSIDRETIFCPRCDRELHITLSDRFHNNSDITCKSCAFKFPIKNKGIIGLNYIIIDNEQLNEDSIHYHN